MSCVHVDLCHEVFACHKLCLSGQLARNLTAAKTLLDITYKFLNFFFYTGYAYRHYWLLPCYTTLSDLDLDWGSQGQHKVKPVGFFFSLFSRIRIKIVCGFEAIQSEHPDTIFQWDFNETREITPVLLTASENLNVGMHLDIYLSTGLLQTWYGDRYYIKLQAFSEG